MTVEQERYQVRFDWAAAGAEAAGADADVLVWVDALPAVDGDAAEPRSLPSRPIVIAASLPDAHAVAQWIVAFQHGEGRRIVIAVVAAGDRRASGEVRFAVEDLLAAGAVIDALVRLGLDATSPEAAAAEAAYRGLDKAVAHLLTASVTAQSARPSRDALRPDPMLGVDDVRVIRQAGAA